MNYSGRTTSYSHKGKDWKDRAPDGQEAIQQVTLFEVQWSTCPVEVQDEVRELWSDQTYGNESFYFHWKDEDNAEYYPVIAEYLHSKNVVDCLIHWWW